MITDALVPSGWTLHKIPEVVFFQEGPGVRKWQYTETGVKLLNVGNINNGVLDLAKTSRHVSEEEGYGRYKHFLVDEGDLIIGSSGITVDTFHKKIAFAKKEHLPLCMNTSTIRFKSLTSNRIDIQFFKYFLTTRLFTAQLQRLITGSAQLNFGPSHLKQMKIPLPPLPEQKRIAAILDKADAVRRKRQKAIRLTEEFLRSVFLDMFGDPVTNPKGWDVIKLNEIVNELRYGTSQKCTDKSRSGTLPVIRIPNVIGEGVNWSDLKYTKLEKKEVAKLLMRQGDILFVRTNGNPEYIARCVVYEGKQEALYASYLIRARLIPDSPLAAEFIKSVVSFPTYRSRLIKEARTTAGNYNINTKGLGNLSLIKPPTQLQDKYLNLLTSSRRMINSFERNQVEQDNLINSLVQRAFRGEL